MFSMDVGSGAVRKIPESDSRKKSIVLKEVPAPRSRRMQSVPQDLRLLFVGEIGDVEGVHRAADQIEIGDRGRNDGLFEARHFLPDEIREAFFRMGKADDRVQIRGAQIQIDEQRPAAELREENAEAAGEEALSRSALPAADRPYLR